MIVVATTGWEAPGLTRRESVIAHQQLSELLFGQKLPGWRTRIRTRVSVKPGVSWELRPADLAAPDKTQDRDICRETLTYRHGGLGQYLIEPRNTIK